MTNTVLTTSQVVVLNANGSASTPNLARDRARLLPQAGPAQAGCFCAAVYAPVSRDRQLDKYAGIEPFWYYRGDH